MEIVNQGGGSKIAYEVQGSVLIFNEGELTLDVKKHQRDFARTLDICRDKFGGLTMGLGENYVAQIEIPAKEYEYVEAEGIAALAVANNEQENETAMLKQKLAFDMTKVKLVLWDI